MRWKNKNLLRWLQESDPYDYYENGAFNASVPQELREPLLRFASRVEEHYMQLFSQRRLEYHALQSRINPHFLYNTLEAVRAQALKAGANDLESMVCCISKFFRYSVSARGEFVTLREELSNVGDYFKIQQYRFQDRFQLQTVIKDDSALDARVPKMILQPIVENAIFHGLEPKRGKGTVTLRLDRTQQDIFIFISDDGVGICESAVRELNSLLQGAHFDPPSSGASRRRGALHNVNARIRLYCGDHYGLAVHSAAGLGTDVELALPFLPSENGQSRVGAADEA